MSTGTQEAQVGDKVRADEQEGFITSTDPLTIVNYDGVHKIPAGAEIEIVKKKGRRSLGMFKSERF